MSTLAEIEHAIKSLKPDEVTYLAKVVLEREAANWDEQLERDAGAGKLDFLAAQAEDALARGTP